MEDLPARRVPPSRRAERERGSPAGGARGTATIGPQPADLAAYRRAVDDVLRDVRDGTVEAALPRAAGCPEVRAVLDRVPGGGQGALDRIAAQLSDFRPSARSNARTPATLLRIALLQQVDVVWWGSLTPFADDADVLGSPQLTSLPALDRRGLLAFRYRVGTAAWAGRARNYAVRRWAPGREPVSSGLSFPVARPAMVGLLNEIATRFAAAAPSWAGRLWVNCIVRSTAGQLRLRELGYSALLPSAHCTGYAADLEMAWLRRHGVAPALEGVLTAYRDAGVLNVIDEGQAWHVCLDPASAGRYADLAPRVSG
ncbi:hypothetical protein [Geodermatophilus sp. TF02-6]|uniref:hypothetical protein n=1 Tax=Geodermatophilus sp. TF02-6 TaxID=2250575 RepID=UPI0011BF5981|nr:hypothetical protein [Geodermatophilus sp. TF02-6]